jgi:hypothetical protein
MASNYRGPTALNEAQTSGTVVSMDEQTATQRQLTLKTWRSARIV